MQKNICHLLIAFGNPNQSYTRAFLEKLSDSDENRHFVFCHRVFQRSKRISVIDSHQQRKIVSLFFFIYYFLKNRNFRSCFKNFSITEKVKWTFFFQQRIDVLHIHHLHAIPIEIIKLCKQYNIKLIGSLRGRDLLINTLDERQKRHLQEKLIQLDEIHCISNYMSSQLYKIFDLEAKVIYRGNSIPKQGNIKTKFSTDSSHFNIIVVGRLVWEKGHVYILEAIKALEQAGYFVHCDIYGEGNYREFLAFRIAQLGLENTVFLKGFIAKEKLQACYKNYDLALQPSISEALSNGLLDLVFHNVPCVISNVGGMPEIVKDGVNGVVFDAKRMLDLKASIIEVKKMNSKTLKEFNQNLINKFSVQKEINSFRMLYEG